MTISLSLDGSNDLFIEPRGKLSVVSGRDAVQQNCETAMKAIQEEMMYALKSGMPYRTVVWDKYNQKLFQAASRSVLRSVQDVVSITSLSSSLNDNILSYTATIKTIYGTITIK